VRACGADVRLGAVPAESKRQGETGERWPSEERNPLPETEERSRGGARKRPGGDLVGPTGSCGTHCLGTAAGRLHAFGLVAVFSLEATAMRGAVNWWWGRGG
jgi:hypothetical protein